jgi:hypothetical protein
MVLEARASAQGSRSRSFATRETKLAEALGEKMRLHLRMLGLAQDQPALFEYQLAADGRGELLQQPGEKSNAAAPKAVKLEIRSCLSIVCL